MLPGHHECYHGCRSAKTTIPQQLMGGVLIGLSYSAHHVVRWRCSCANLLGWTYVPSLALYHHMCSACLTGGDPLGYEQCSDQVTCNKLIVSHNAGYQVCHGCKTVREQPRCAQPMFPSITDVPGGEKCSSQVIHCKAIICTACAIRSATGVPWA